MAAAEVTEMLEEAEVEETAEVSEETSKKHPMCQKCSPAATPL